jgi:hypothetical protein
VKERDHLGAIGVDGRIILKRSLKKGSYKAVDYIQLAQNMVKWRAVLNIVMKWTIFNWLRIWSSGVLF